MTEDHMIMLRMKLITDRIRQVADAAFAEYSLTGPQVGYLNYIRRNGGSISQKELERAAGVSHPTIVGVTARLQDKGYVEIRIDEKDRRNRIIELTDKARNATLQLRKGSEGLNGQLVRGMTPEDETELNRLLDIIDKNLNELQEKGERRENESK